MKSNFLINRRTCLKGIGATLALPLLETMGWAEPGQGKPNKPPIRLGFSPIHASHTDKTTPTPPPV